MNKLVIFVILFQHVLSKLDNTWWKHTTLYEVYLPSFKDSNGDGLGDLPGLTSKLDHIVELGIETVYITPFYVSPMEEGGYDISNFTAVNPIFGTMADFDELVAEANKRGLKVIIDVVMNHSSDKHPWFIKSVNRIQPYTDYYVWKDPKYDSEGNAMPPNNWVSVFGGSGWEWNEKRKQFYFHQFTPQQPDFNLRNKVVRKEMKKILKFWLDRGVAGFRLDATNFFIEDAEFRDEPLASPDIKVAKTMWDLVHVYTLFTQESYDFLHEIRVYCDRVTKTFTDYERILVPETYATGKLLTKYYGSNNYKIAHFPLNFALVLITEFQNATFYKEIIDTYLNSLPEGATPSWNSENHDKFRKASVFGEEYEFIFTTMVMTLPGVAYIYYGQEIGMTGSRIRNDQQVDKFVDDFTKKPRDSARLPMQWDDSLNAGFSNNRKIHLPLTSNYWRINVERQKYDKNSHYHLFKKLMALRSLDAFKSGTFKSYIISTWVFAFTRISKRNEIYLVIMNLGSETEFVDLKHSIPEVGNVMKIEVASPNSGYQSNDRIPMTSAMPKILALKPLAIMILSSR